MCLSLDRPQRLGDRDTLIYAALATPNPPPLGLSGRSLEERKHIDHNYYRKKRGLP